MMMPAIGEIAGPIWRTVMAAIVMITGLEQMLCDMLARLRLIAEMQAAAQHGGKDQQMKGPAHDRALESGPDRRNGHGTASAEKGQRCLERGKRMAWNDRVAIEARKSGTGSRDEL